MHFVKGRIKKRMKNKEKELKEAEVAKGKKEMKTCEKAK
jgi:hypothetical protein